LQPLLGVLLKSIHLAFALGPVQSLLRMHPLLAVFRRSTLGLSTALTLPLKLNPAILPPASVLSPKIMLNGTGESRTNSGLEAVRTLWESREEPRCFPLFGGTPQEPGRNPT
jgi:hypothetical protein